MAYSQTDLDRLDKAIASGALRVTVAGRDVIYRSLAELREARGIVAAALNTASGVPTRRRSVNGVSQGGW